MLDHPARRRRIYRVGLIGALIAALAVTGSAVLARHGQDATLQVRSYVPDHQVIARTTSTGSTSNTGFVDLPGLSGIPVVNRGPSTLTFSGNFGGAPIVIRAERNGHALFPRTASFSPTVGGTSFSFTFATEHGASGCSHYDVQWRSRTGAAATFQGGTAVLDYKVAKPEGGAICD